MSGNDNFRSDVPDGAVATGGNESTADDGDPTVREPSTAGQTGEESESVRTTDQSESVRTTDQSADAEGETFDPIGTMALVLIYLSILVVAWVYIYFVEFLGGDLIVVG